MEECTTSDSSKSIDESEESHRPCDLKPHFIIKEYCGRNKIKRVPFYLEEKLIQPKLDDETPTDTPKNTQKKNLTRKEKKAQSTRLGLFRNMALLGGAMVGGVIGLYVYAKSEE